MVALKFYRSRMSQFHQTAARRVMREAILHGLERRVQYRGRSRKIRVAGLQANDRAVRRLSARGQIGHRNRMRLANFFKLDI